MLKELLSSILELCYDNLILLFSENLLNFIKSLFITIAPAWLCYVAVVSLMMLSKGFHLITLGVLISALPLLLFLGQLLLFKKMARTSQHLPLVLIPSLLGYVVTLIYFLTNPEIYYLRGLMFSMASFLITLMYIYWYSNNARAVSNDIDVSKKLPIFEVFDTDGSSINSTGFLGNKTLIFFYRGNWCPFCVAQINEMVESYQKFDQHAVSVIFISPQKSEYTKKLAKKFHVPIKFYVDKENKAAKALGIEHKFGLPMGFQLLGYQSHSVFPTVIAINEASEIVFCDQNSNYRLRPEVDNLLKLFL